MGAEDKFPILIYALIKSNTKRLRSHAQFLSDFVNEHVGDMDSRYRVAELNDAIKYIENLEWSVRDKHGSLVPVKLILSNVGWTAKGLQKTLKVPDGYDRKQAQADIIVALSTIFRRLSERTLSPFDSFLVPSAFNLTVKTFRSVFDQAFGKEVGLKLMEKEPAGPGGEQWQLEFEIKHPLYVYAQLAQVAIAPDAADLST